MKYGFVIDNRKCIGCHACTTACKSEHQVPVGVNRTWVKQVEKGTFPDTRRLFSVMRCNHCSDAPCVTICPTEALFTREDGIVDFDNDRCIGCKSCMQACPYDALYINPDNNTAAKCNYCAHRIDIGLEPACVNVCPEHAIISGDMDDPSTEISNLLARQSTKVRKPEKNTQPNLFYIDADDVSLIPSATEKTDHYLYSSQGLGVGHYAKEAEKLAFSNDDVISELANISAREQNQRAVPRTVEVVMSKHTRAYDAPDKGVLWGWEVSAYVWTKAIASGIGILMLVLYLAGYFPIVGSAFSLWALAIAMTFMGLTGLFLVMDLDRPDRFLNVLLRPHWNSWLVKGGYGITFYGGLVLTSIMAIWFEWTFLLSTSIVLMGVSGLFVAIYTAYLFAQAKGRDFWQSPVLPWHMLIHAAMAGSATLIILSDLLLANQKAVMDLLRQISMASIVVNLMILGFELSINHPTKDAGTAAKMITSGNYRNKFWLGVILIGNFLPLILFGLLPQLLFVPSLCLLIGILITEHIWVEAPQKIPLS